MKGEPMLKKVLIKNDVIRQRLFLVRLVKKKGVTQACLELGKHRSYYYYWIKRYEKEGWRGLQSKSCRPKKMPRLTCKKKVKAILEVRRLTAYGKERIHDELKVRGLEIPVATIGKVLERAGVLVKKRRFKTQKKHTRVYNLIKPGQRVQLDIKYVPSEKCPRGKKMYQYTVIDECTRMRFMTWHDSIWVKRAVDTLEGAQRYFPFKIKAVQTDNGIEFTYNYTAQLQARNKDPIEHPLDVYCKEKCIQHKLIPPGEKELNGKVERSHRTDQEEFYNRIKRVKDLRDLRKKGRDWLRFYNYHRRHSSIQKLTPHAFLKQRLELYPDTKCKSA
jgi:transposase InsO family protein